MKAKRVDISDDGLLDLNLAAWSESEKLSMMPAPVAMVVETSPFLAMSQDHGVTKGIETTALHNGKMLAVRVKWSAAKHDVLADLTSFVDGVAILFPLARGASAITMGGKGKPTNAWYWKANMKDPFEVVAEGFNSVTRMKGMSSDLKVVSRHQNGEWSVIFRRSLASDPQLVKLAAGRSSKIAFAVWDGGNAERSGRKAISGDFVELMILK